MEQGAIHRKQPLAVLFHHVWHLYKGTLRSVLPLTITIAALVLIPNIFKITAGNKQIPTEQMALMVFLGIIQIIPLTALYCHIFNSNDPNKASLYQSIQAGISQSWKVLLSTMLLIALYAAGFILFTIPYLFFKIFLGSAAAMLVFLIPMLFIMVSFYLYLPLIAIFHHGPIDALKLSYHLVIKHWWRVAVIISVPSMAILAMKMAVYIAGAVLLPETPVLTTDPTMAASHANILSTLQGSAAVECSIAVIHILTISFFPCLAMGLLNDLCLLKGEPISSLTHQE